MSFQLGMTSLRVTKLMRVERDRWYDIICSNLRINDRGIKDVVDKILHYPLILGPSSLISQGEQGLRLDLFRVRWDKAGKASTWIFSTPGILIKLIILDFNFPPSHFQRPSRI